MKKISYIILGMAATLLFAGCMKFLSEEPKTFLSPENYYVSEAQMQDAVNGMYPPVNSAYMDGLVAPNHTTFIMLETLTGYHKRNHAYDSRTLGYNLPLSDDNGLLQNNWVGMYTAISRVNYTLEGIENSTASVSTETKNRFLGEAHFIRAYAYFFLVQLYGPVPMPLKPVKAKSDIVTELTPISGVYEQILADLTEAEKLLTVWNPGNGHVGLGAVKALLAKVLLAMAGYPLQQTEHYAQALAKAKEVKNSGAFSLYKDVHDLANSAKRNKEEAIYAIQYSKGSANSGMPTLFLPYYAGWDAEKIADNQAFGGAIVPSQTFINTYDDGDKRAQEKGWYYNSYKTLDGGTAEFPQPFIYKYFDADYLSSNQSDVQFPFLRYSDILLVLAEAACAGGNSSDPDAIDAYYQVHNRWSPIVKPASISFEDVYKERVWELCFEGKNWFDMLRTRKIFNVSSKRVVDMVGFKPQEHSDPFTEDCLLFPYPVSEKRLNENLANITVAERLALK